MDCGRLLDSQPTQVVRDVGDVRAVIFWLACGGEVTFHDDIAPLVDRSCLPCHAEGGASGLGTSLCRIWWLRVRSATGSASGTADISALV